MARRLVLVGLLALGLTGCDLLGEYQARKEATKMRLQSGGAAPGVAPPGPAPNVPQPMPMQPMPMQPMPMPMPMPAGT